MNKFLLPFAGALLAGSVLIPVSAVASAPAPECTAGDLVAHFGSTDAGMSHVYGVMRLRNVSGHDCVVQGYGGLSYVGPHGKQIGKAASRTRSATPRTLLKPGQRAVSKVEMTTTGPYSPQTCRARKVLGFRLYVPDATAAKFVPYKTKACSNTKLTTLWHKAYRSA